MPAPAEALPDFATDPTFANDGDDWGGAANKINFGSARRAEGFEPDLLPAEWLNFLFNRSGLWMRYLAGFVDGVTDELRYPVAKTRRKVLLASEVPFLTRTGGSYAEQWFPTTVNNGAVLLPVVDGAQLIVPFDLPSTSEITGVEVLVTSSASRVNPNGWQVRVYSQICDWLTPALPSAVQQGSTTSGGLPIGPSKLTVGSLTPFSLIEGARAFATITGPTGSLGLSDRFIGLRVTFHDFGPRAA